VKMLHPPTNNTSLYMNISRHILVSRYIHVKTCINGRREYVVIEICCSNAGGSACIFTKIHPRIGVTYNDSRL
jgi:hypothetical protein